MLRLQGSQLRGVQRKTKPGLRDTNQPVTVAGWRVVNDRRNSQQAFDPHFQPTVRAGPEQLPVGHVDPPVLQVGLDQPPVSENVVPPVSAGVASRWCVVPTGEPCRPDFAVPFRFCLWS